MIIIPSNQWKNLDTMKFSNLSKVMGIPYPWGSPKHCKMNWWRKGGVVYGDRNLLLSKTLNKASLLVGGLNIHSQILQKVQHHYLFLDMSCLAYLMSKACGRKDSVWLLRLGGKRPCGYLLALSLGHSFSSGHLLQGHWSSPLERSMWQGIEASCQQPARNWVRPCASPYLSKPS